MRLPSETYEAVERRRTIIRTILFMIILGTLPFYVIGFLLLGSAPADAEEPITTDRATITPIADEPSNTPGLRPSNTPRTPLGPTPPQFRPPQQTFVIPPTGIILPTSTTAPSLTPRPTDTPQPTSTTPPPPTATLPIIMPPTDTPRPTDPPLLPPPGQPGPGGPPLAESTPPL